MTCGKIIFLNGTSSAGKTTLAYALQEQLTEPWIHIALDQFRDGLPLKYRGLNAPAGTTGEQGLNVVPIDNSYTNIRFGRVGKTVLNGMRRAIAAMAHAGNNVIIDDIILQPEFLDDYLYVLEDLEVVFVGVKCPENVLNDREQARPGRFPGTASGHLQVCHAHNVYDVEVDTSIYAPQECAARIIDFMTNSRPWAFEQLSSERRLAVD